jgi:hypothetical protein
VSFRCDVKSATPLSLFAAFFIARLKVKVGYLDADRATALH